jgi:hypothetical protein
MQLLATNKAKVIVAKNPQRSRRKAGWRSEDLQRIARFFRSRRREKICPHDADLLP